MMSVDRMHRFVTWSGRTVGGRSGSGVEASMRLMVLSIVCVSTSCGTPREERATCPAIEIGVAADARSDASRSIALTDGGHILLTEEPLVTSADITGARASLTEGQYVLNITLTRDRAKGVQLFSQRNVGRTLVFLVDGRVVRTPEIRDPITGNGFLIGPLERGEAERLADAINSGCGA